MPPDVRKGSAFPADSSFSFAVRLRLAGAGEGARVPGMKDRRIVIIGFMGCGKTTVAKALARQLRCKSIDLDSFITNCEGRSPAQIIDQDGEREFRKIESRALRQVIKSNEARVIALGGGAWTIEANRELVKRNMCLSVWLNAPFELCWKRITRGKTFRPLAPDRESAQKIFKSRMASYALASMRVPVQETDSGTKIAGKISSIVTKRP